MVGYNLFYFYLIFFGCGYAALSALRLCVKNFFLREELLLQNRKVRQERTMKLRRVSAFFAI